jgi:hypothetical protein
MEYSPEIEYKSSTSSPGRSVDNLPLLNTTASLV